MCVNKITLALTIMLWSSIGQSLHANCKYALTYLDPVRARGAVTGILPVPLVKTTMMDELGRVDDLLILRMIEHLQRLSPDQRENFLRAFERFTFDHTNMVAGIYSVMSSGGAELDTDSAEHPVVAVDPYARVTFLGRLQMIHQFVLVETAVNGGSPAYTKYGVYREAVQYYKDQYRFLHQAFTLEQANNLRGMISVFDERRKERLVKAEVLALAFGTPGPGVFNLDLAQKLGLGLDLGFYLQEMANQRFVFELHQAFEMTESQYIKFKISQNGYRRAQRRLMRTRRLRDAWDVLFFWRP